MVDVIQLWPSLAEFFVYDETIYRLLAGDEARNTAYERAFRSALPGKTVVEVGPGTELVLSRLCLDAGATHVYAVEILEETYRRAKERIDAMGLGDCITLIHGDVTRITLPGKVDYCVSEIVGPIGGSEGAAGIINSCRRFLKNPAHMIPSRSRTHFAGVHLPWTVVQAGFTDIGRHYVQKTFDQLGRPFDLRVCLKNIPPDHLLSTAALFEDLDYTSPIAPDERRPVELRFTRAGEFTGFLVWLELFVDPDQVIDVLGHQQSWLPVYFPVEHPGIRVEAGDRFEGVVVRTPSSNGLNPDYAIEGELHRGNERIPICYSAPHFETRFRSNAFYQEVFRGLGPVQRVPGPPVPGNGVRLDWPEIPITGLFEQQVIRTPDRIALIDGRDPGPRAQWTYRAVNERANRIAYRLREDGVGPDVPVGVYLDRSADTVVALLGILKAGGAYVPLDRSHPSDHIRFVLEQTGAPVVVTESRLVSNLPEGPARCLCLDSLLDSGGAESGNVPARRSLDHLALILYTSGSTGQPKGVAMDERQLLNRFHWLWQSYPFQDGERVGQRTTVSFIPSLWEMLGGLLKGTPTVMLPDDIVKDPARLIRVMAEERITRAALVPSLLKMLLDYAPDLGKRLPSLKLWFVAGDVLTPELYGRFLKALPGAVLHNDYGSTEVSGVLAFDSRWSGAPLDRVPAGRPIANCQAYILDEQLREVGPGVIGDLYIGGAPLSRGYIGHPDWTAEKFIPDPFSGVAGGRLYAMGDMAAWRPDGMIELHGRRDHQVKIRGVRVELAGVEAVLARHQDVRENAVGVHRDSSGENSLIAYVAFTSAPTSPESLLDFLRQQLPEAMVPSRIVTVEALPRTPNGKIDRTRLWVAGPAAAESDHGPEDIGDIRQQVRGLVAGILGHPLDAGADEESFPRLGVHSVAMSQLSQKVSDWAGREIGVTDLFDHFSIRRLSDFVGQTRGLHSDAGRSGAGDDPDAIAVVGYSGRFPDAPDCNAFWKNLEAGVDSIREVPADRWDIGRYYDPSPEAPDRSVGKWGGFLDGIDQFDPLFFGASPREARWMDPQQRLFIEECWKALEHAGYSDRAVSGRRVGVFAGVRPSDYLSPRHELRSSPDALTLLGNDSAILASRVSHFLNLKGPNLSIDTSCSSSLTAIHLACRSLRDGESTMALAGGVSVITAPDFFIQATKAGMLSPTGRCRTFDRDADGFVPGEGVGVLVLKTLTRARRDGDRIHGVIRATGINQDGHTGGLTVPNTLSQSELEQAVYNDAGIDPGTIGYVEAHGTGTRLGDPIEVEALTRAFGAFTSRKTFCRIGSVKENIGHLAAAAGIAGVIKVLLALRHRTIPPNVHVRNVNPHIDFDQSPFLLGDTAVAWTSAPGTPRRSAVSAFGFSGTNAHLVIEEAPAPAPRLATVGTHYLFTLSARTERALDQKRRDLIAWLRGPGREELPANISYTLNARRSHFEHRSWWVASSVEDLERQMKLPVSSEGELAELGERYADGFDPDWKVLYLNVPVGIVDVPAYPFDRKGYWHSQRRSPGVPPMFRPRWVEAGRIGSSRSVSGAIDFTADSDDALLELFRLTRELDPDQPVHLNVRVGGVYDDTDPVAASVFGFCMALRRERPRWTIHCVDAVPEAFGLASEPGCYAVRNEVCYRRRLEPVTLPANSRPAFREGGVYLIAGGAGGIGLALARYLSSRYRAHPVLAGRRASGAVDQNTLAAIGAVYLQADVADPAAIRDVVGETLARYGTLDGVFHAAIELNDAPLSEMDEAAFVAGLGAKIPGTRALWAAVRSLPLDFFCCFSSVQSFLGNAGQANYAAASAFQDTWARGANRSAGFPVRTINWGFWGDVGAVATPGFRKLWASRGVGSIAVDEGMEAVERILASGEAQVAVVKGDRHFLETLGVESDAPIDRVAIRLHQAFASSGVLTAPGERWTVAGLKQHLGVAARHERLFDAMLAMLSGAGIIASDSGAIVVLRVVDPVEPASPDAASRLVEECLEQFAPLLRGETPGAEVLFPGGSMDRVTGLYQGRAESEAVRDTLVQMFREGPDPRRELRILEIGAGTGGTTAAVLPGLTRFADRVKYTFTDISPAFIQHGARRFASAYPFLECRLLDIGTDPVSQGFEAGSFDVVIAANVLHATPNIGRTLERVRALLAPSGRLVLQEQTRLEPFLTVTFGWLEGWWLFEDERLPHSPLLDAGRWRSALDAAGFSPITVALERSVDSGQHVLVAGIAGTTPSAVVEAPSDRVGGAREHVLTAIRSVLELDASDVDPDKPFSDYGVDSILAQALANTLSRSMGIALKASEIYTYPTVRVLSAHLGACGRELRASGSERNAPGAGVSAATSGSRSTDGSPADERAIAIIGYAGRFPGADDVDAFWRNLASGRSSIREVPRSRWDVDAVYDPDPTVPGKTNSRWGGFLSDIDRFDPHFFRILPLEAEWMDPQQRLFLQEAWRALEDAAYADRSLDGLKCGVFAGCKEGDYARLYPSDHDGPYRAVAGNSSILAARIAYALNLKGPALAVDTACSSSLVAIQLACERLARHPEEIALAGGVSVMCTPHTHLLLGRSGMLSPKGRSKTFDETADGFVPGEAVGVVVLKSLRSALRDGDPIRAVIRASDMNQDGRTSGITAPSASAQTALERDVYGQARIDPGSISYIETHGTGTKLGDPIEIAGLRGAFGSSGRAALGSVKTNVGHTLAAAGIVSVIKVLECLKHRKLVPTLNLERLNPEIDLSGCAFSFNTELKDWTDPDDGPLRAAVSSFGFSGTNVHMVLEEPPVVDHRPLPRPAWWIPLSAKTPAALGRRIDDLLRRLEQDRFAIEDVAFTLIRGRSHFAVRAAVIAGSGSELIERLRDLGSGTASDAVFRIRESTPEEPALRQWGDDVLDEVARGAMPPERYRERLRAMADLFTRGYALDWDRLAPDGTGRRISLPVYPFEAERYWIADAGVTDAPASARIPDLWTLAWTRSAAGVGPVSASPDSGPVIVLAGTRARGLAESLFDDRDVRVVGSPAALNACRPHDALSGCIDLTAFDPDPSWREAIVTFLQAQIDRHRLSGLRLIQVCHKLHAHEVDTTCLDGADLAGLYRTIGAEYPRVDSRVLDTDEGLENPGQIRRQILDEWARGPARFGCCCYRNGRRFSAGLVPEARIGPDDDDADRAYPDGGVLLVTGGTRGVGRAMVDDAIARGVRKVAILGRDPIPPRAEWDRYPADSALGEKIAHFEAWMDQGVELEIYTGPLTDRDALVDFRQRIHRNLGSVFGVLHCAGLARTGHPAFIRKPIADMRAVCEPKIEGLQCLDAIFGDEPLDFFVLFSSVASALPTLGSGQSDYAMANAYMDYFARHRFSQGRRHYRSIQWPNWDGIGMGGATSAAYGATGLLSHTRAEGIGLFRRALAVDVPVVLPCVHRGALDWAGTTPEEGRAAVVGSRSIRQWIDDLFARELKLSPGQLEPDTPFIELGLDSILMAELVRAMERGLKIPLDPSLLFEHTTLNRLVDFLGDRVPPMPDAPTAAPAAAPAPAPMTLASGVSSGTRILPDNPPAAPVSLRKRETDDIAIVGLSCRFPQAPDPEAFWNLLRRGETAMGPVPPERWNQIDPQWFGGFLNNLDLFDPGFFSLADDDARVMGPQARILLEESIGALYEAGYDERTFEGRNVGVYVGARAMVIPAVETLRDAPNPILGLGQNYLAANVSRFLDLRGPSLVIDTACSSALVAMHAAVLALRRGDIDCALVGGVSVLANDESHRLFASRNLLRPDGVFHLFDRRADGVVLGEGAGCLVLKRLADATAEGNRVRAVVRGIAVNNNGRTAGPNAPNLEAQVQVVSAALRDAGMSGSEISAVETSGAGSQIPDLVELKSLAYALGRPDPASRIRYLGSVKANIGHLLSGAGLASFIKAVLGLQAGELPPFISGQEAPEHFDLDRAGFGFNRQVEHWPSIAGVRAAAVQSFPDGGTNCAVIVASFSDGPEPGEPSRGRPAFVKKRLSVDPSGTDESITDKILSGTNGDDFWGFDA